MKYCGLEKISVIVIIYNVENYLKKCINSIRKQSYENLEILLVDDGSTDGSQELCDKVAKEDNRIVVIHKDNGGLVSARKVGVEAATGDYIAFVDGDDWVDEDMYEKLYLEAKLYGADIVLSGISREMPTGRKNDLNTIAAGFYDKQKLETDVYPKMMFYLENRKGFIDASLCTKLFTSDIIKKALEQVDEKIFYLGEDAATLYPCLLMAKNIYATDFCMYHHNKIIANSEQASYKKEKAFERLFLLYTNLKENFEKTEYKYIMLPQLNDFFLHMLNVRIKEEIDVDLLLFYQALTIRAKYKFYLPIESIVGYKNIILYGAGNVGREYFCQLKENNINIVMWVDQQAEKYRSFGMDVYKIDEIGSVSFDIILLAVKQEGMASSIKQLLIEKGLFEDKIKWLKPIENI